MSQPSKAQIEAITAKLNEEIQSALHWRSVALDLAERLRAAEGELKAIKESPAKGA